MSSSEDISVFKNPDLPKDAFPLMEEIRRHGKLCDVTLKIEDAKFSAHRIVLAATIPYFNAMFTHDMRESNMDTITMQGIEVGALEALINYAYNGRIQLTQDNVESILVGASYLHLQAVKDACCTYLKDRLHPNNCLGIRTFADQLMCPTLVEAAEKYIQKHFIEVSRQDEYLNLNSTQLIDIIRRDNLYILTEEQVFEAVMRWLKKDADMRQQYLANVLRYVRLPLLTPQYLSDRVAHEPLIHESLECRDLVDEAKDYHLMPERRLHFQTFKTIPRTFSDITGVIYAVGGLTSSGHSLNTVEYYDLYLTVWKLGQPMCTLRSRVGVSVLNGLLYAIGGYDGKDRLSTVEVYNPQAKQWKLVAPMMCKRSALGAVSLNNKVYVCGGYDGETSLSSVECYCPNTDKWSSVGNMQKSRSASGVCVFEGQIYSLGGHNGLQIFDSVEYLDQTTNTWKVVTPMRSKRCRLGCAVVNGKLYAAGGYDGNVFLKSVECYDPVTQTWINVAPMNVNRSRVALVANAGKLFAIGGYDGVTNLNTVEVYNPDTNTWEFLKPMSAHEGGVGVGVIPVPPIELSD